MAEKPTCPSAWRAVQEILLSRYGVHQECDATCTDASFEDEDARDTAHEIVTALLDQRCGPETIVVLAGGVHTQCGCGANLRPGDLFGHLRPNGGRASA